MTDRILAAFGWYSRKGASQSENRDLGAFLRGEQFALGMIADSFGSHVLGSDYAVAFINDLVLRLARPVRPSATAVMRACRDAHEGLRRPYAGGRFCFALVCVYALSGDAWSIHCGDCRIGTRSIADEVVWRTAVHRETFPNEEAFDLRHVLDPDRQGVTRFVGLRPPDFEITHFERGCSDFILATDGFWAPHVLGSVESAAHDDCSVLAFHVSHDMFVIDSDCSNFGIWSARRGKLNWEPGRAPQMKPLALTNELAPRS